MTILGGAIGAYKDVAEVDQLAFYNEFIAEKLRKYGNNSAAAPRLAQNYARFMAIYNLYLSKFPFYNTEDRRLKQTTVQLAAMRLTIELFRKKADEDRGGQPADAVLFAIGGDHAESVPMSAVFGSAGYDVAAQMLVRAQRFWMNLQRCPTYIQYALDLCSMTGEEHRSGQPGVAPRSGGRCPSSQLANFTQAFHCSEGDNMMFQENECNSLAP
ncbi:unnamed protein product, partial [Mesorhabditis spiculigera]